MKSNYRKLGEYIREVNIKNKNLDVDLLLGVSITKEFIPSIANTIGTDFSNYKIVRKHQFAYGPVTSRNGDKISVALLKENVCIISSSYMVFEIIDTDKLLPEYLMMWFRRPEFDRYARFKSEGSVREIFSWNEMCNVELPIPTIEKQRKIVEQYNQINKSIQIKESINNNLEQQAQAIFKSWFIDYKPFGGEMPNDWKTAAIEDVATFSQGVQVPVEEQYFEFADNLKRFIRIIDITQPQHPDIRYINDPQRGYVDYSDIFMIRYGTPGIISRNFKGVIANNLFKISSKNNNVTDNYLFQFFNSENMQNYLTRNAVSSTMPAINFSTLYRQEIIIPSNDIMLKFTKLDETIRKQSLNIKREIQLLLNIRKNVLSKLMLENSDSSTAKLSFSKK